MVIKEFNTTLWHRLSNDHGNARRQSIKDRK